MKLAIGPTGWADCSIWPELNSLVAKLERAGQDRLISKAIAAVMAGLANRK